MPACNGDRPAVVLRVNGMAADTAAELAGQLKRALDGRGLDLCVGEARAPAATLDVGPSTDGVTLVLGVDDAVTNKRVQRDVDVRSLPPDARALAIAQAADELLRASWAELYVDGATTRPDDAPRAVREAVQLRPSNEVPEPRRRWLEVRLGMAAEVFSSGHRQLGPDVAVAAYPSRMFGVVARGGPRAAAGVDTPLGAIAMAGVVLSVGTVARASPRPWLSVEAGPVVTASRLALDGAPAPGVTARDVAVVVVYAAGEGRLRIDLSRAFHAGVSAGVGAPIRTARAVSAGEVLHEVSGLVLAGQLHVGLEL